MRTTTPSFEDGLELYRQCRNILLRGFSGQYLSALRNFCLQRQRLVEERRRLASLSMSASVECNNSILQDGALVMPSPGCAGVLALFTTKSSFSVIDGLVAQLEADIGEVVGQLHESTNQMSAAHKRLAEIAMEYFISQQRGAHTDGEGGYGAVEVASAMLSMARMCAEVRVWMSRALSDLRTRLVSPSYDAAAVHVAGLSWWDAAQAQPVDADKVWHEASRACLSDVARILILSSV